MIISILRMSIIYSGGKQTEYIMIFEWCSFIDNKDMADNEYDNDSYQCPCCGLYMVELV
jgi:hypothetical protein